MDKSIVGLTSVLAAVMLSGCTVQLRANAEPISIRTGDYVHIAKLERGDFKLQSEGWDKLGQRAVDGNLDVDTIFVGQNAGHFEHILIVVEHGDLQLFEVEIVLTDGTRFRPTINHRFRAASPTLAIDLPGGKRSIASVTFRYGNLPGGGSAQLELWAR